MGRGPGIEVRDIFLFKVFRSRYCLLVFFLGLPLGYALIPRRVFAGWYLPLGALYIIVFATVLMCVVRILKERVVSMKSTGASLLSIVASALGLGALQVCGVGAPVCGATLGAGLLSIVFPRSALLLFNEYATYIILSSILVQLFAIYYMGCLRRCLSSGAR